MRQTKHETVKNYNGKPIGYIFTDTEGNKVIKNSNNVIIGYYDARINVTKNKNNVILYRGDYSLALIHGE